MTNSSSSSIILQQDQHAHGSHEEKLCQQRETNWNQAQFSTLLTPKRGVLQGSEHRNIAKNSAITTILQKKSAKIPQHFNTESKIDVMPKPLLCLLRLEQITRKW